MSPMPPIGPFGQPAPREAAGPMTITKAGDDLMRSRVARVKEDLATAIERVRSNTMLNDRGKRDAIAKLYTRAHDKVMTLRSDQDNAKANRRRTLENDLLGTGGQRDALTASISLRDAAQRVDAVKAGDRQALSALLNTATRTGDQMLAKAILRRAVDEYDDVLVEQYTDAHPALADAVGELLSLRPPSPVQDLVVERMGGSSAFRQELQNFFNDLPLEVEKPVELARYVDSQIAAMAGGDGDDVATFMNVFVHNAPGAGNSPTYTGDAQ